MAADAQPVTLLTMLDLSAAFDCVVHAILLQRLQLGAGFRDIVLEWISSFLLERTQQIAYNGDSVQHTTRAVRRTPRQRLRTVAVRALHCGIVPRCRSASTTAAHVRG